MKKSKNNYIPTSFRFTHQDIRLFNELTTRTNINNRTDLVRHALQRWLDQLIAEKSNQNRS